MCLDMQGGSSAKGAHIIQWHCDATDHAQLWALFDTDINDHFTYVNFASDTCMTASADSMNNGAPMQGWPCTSKVNGDHSYWTAAPFAGGPLTTVTG
jgi:Ricin-type beta-trefoil lectin domain